MGTSLRIVRLPIVRGTNCPGANCPVATSLTREGNLQWGTFAYQILNVATLETS
jgi:hypothetical protein